MKNIIQELILKKIVVNLEIIIMALHVLKFLLITVKNLMLVISNVQNAKIIIYQQEIIVDSQIKHNVVLKIQQL